MKHPSHVAFGAGCRCEPCVTFKRAYKRDYSLRKGLVKTGRVNRREMEHGTLSAYVHKKCRCKPCAQANTEYMRAYREIPGTPYTRKNPKLSKVVVHGTWSGYNYWKCKCELCKAAGKKKYQNTYATHNEKLTLKRGYEK